MPRRCGPLPSWEERLCFPIGTPVPIALKRVVSAFGHLKSTSQRTEARSGLTFVGGGANSDRASKLGVVASEKLAEASNSASASGQISRPHTTHQLNKALPGPHARCISPEMLCRQHAEPQRGVGQIAIALGEPVGHNCQLRSLAGQEHGRTIPLPDIGRR